MVIFEPKKKSDVLPKNSTDNTFYGGTFILYIHCEHVFNIAFNVVSFCVCALCVFQCISSSLLMLQCFHFTYLKSGFTLEVVVCACASASTP